MISKIIKNNDFILWDYLYWFLVTILFAGVLYLFSFKNGIILSSVLIITLIFLFLCIENRKLLFFFFFFFLATSIRTPESLLEYQFSISELFLYLLLVLSLPKFSSIKLFQKLKENKAFTMYVFYSLTMLLALIINWYGDLQNNLNAIRVFTLPIVLYIILLINIKRNNARTIILALIVIAIISGIIGILQSCFGVLNFVHNELNRDYLSLIIGNKIGFAKPATGLFDHWNSMALYIQLYVVLMLAFSLKLEKKLYRNLSIILFIFFLIVQLLTFSRGGYISSLIGIIVLLWVNSKKTRVISIISLGIVILVTIIYLIPSIVKYYNQFESIFYRFNLWYKGIQYLIRNPQKIFFGTGWNSYPSIAKDVYTAHNIYILHLVEMGIFNLIMLIVFIYSVLRYFYKSYLEANSKIFQALSLGLFAGYFGYFIHEFIEHSFAGLLFRNQLMIWLLLTYILKKEIRDEENSK